MNIYYTYILFILVILIQINSQNVNVNLDDVLYTNIDQSTVYQEKWDHYDNSVVVSTVFGEIVGFSIAANRSDLQSQCKEVPCWALKRINVFLGIPYAQPPVGNLRFRRPKLPKWTDLPINATSYKPDCPQIRMGKLKYLQKDDYISEDCLYLNIFAPNISLSSGKSNNKKYPVMIIIGGSDFVEASGRETPGNILAAMGIIVISMNYRVGSLGFLTTGDEILPGNYGLWDQRQAIEFVRLNIAKFGGDVKNITLAGINTGAASAAIHMRNAQFAKHINKLILMSGSDTSPTSYNDPFGGAEKYFWQLAKLSKCPFMKLQVFQTLNCLRNIPWKKLVQYDKIISTNKTNGIFSYPWSPAVDNWTMQRKDKISPSLIESRYIYKTGQIYNKEIPLLAGINWNDGLETINRIVSEFNYGNIKNLYNYIFTKMVNEYQPLNYLNSSNYFTESLKFRYTYWSNVKNKTAQIENFIQFITDWKFGAPIDDMINRIYEHNKNTSIYRYVFDYQSWQDKTPELYSRSESSILPYALGFPLFNWTTFDVSNIALPYEYDGRDRNMSRKIIFMWNNFTYYGVPIKYILMNDTWAPYNKLNYSYLRIGNVSRVYTSYRQNYYEYWKYLVKKVLDQDAKYVTITPVYELPYIKGISLCIVASSMLLVSIAYTITLIYKKKIKLLLNYYN